MLGSHNIFTNPEFLRTNSSLRWRYIIREYSRRRMSFEADKLPAIAALAQDYAENNNTDYLAGLWKNTLALDLLWIVESSSLTAKRPMAYRAPSWSWAAVNEPVGWKRDRYGRASTGDSSFDVYGDGLGWFPCLKEDMSPLGQLCEGSILRLRGCVVQLGTKAELWRRAQDLSAKTYMEKYGTRFIGADDESADEPLYKILGGNAGRAENSIRFDDTDHESADEPVYALLTAWLDPGPRFGKVPIGLLLSRYSCEGEITYRRVGLFHNAADTTVTAEDFMNVVPEIISLM